VPIALDTLALVLLSPILMVQAGLVRRAALVLPEAAGLRQGQAGTTGAQMSLLIIGDSSAAGVGVDHQEEALSGQLAALMAQDHRLTWRLEARTGATTASALRHLQRTPMTPAGTVVVILGVNDIIRLVPLRRLLQQRAALYALLQNTVEAKHILISGLPPMGRFPLLPNPLRWLLGQRAARFDKALAQQAEALGLTYLRQSIPFDPTLMAVDGFHPSAAACRLWAQTIAVRLRAEGEVGTPPG
jgi:lysophospholipase L1-like esterase